VISRRKGIPPNFGGRIGKETSRRSGKEKGGSRKKEREKLSKHRMGHSSLIRRRREGGGVFFFRGKQGGRTRERFGGESGFKSGVPKRGEKRVGKRKYTIGARGEVTPYMSVKVTGEKER